MASVTACGHLYMGASQIIQLCINQVHMWVLAAKMAGELALCIKSAPHFTEMVLAVRPGAVIEKHSQPGSDHECHRAGDQAGLHTPGGA